jgi:hypothetical protein
VADRQISYFVTAVVAVATPATVAISLYSLTGDPGFRPYSTAEDYLVGPDPPSDARSVAVLIHWPGAPDAPAAHAFAESLRAAFAGQGAPTQIRLRPAARGAGPEVTFVVGANRFGPYPPAASVDGAAAAMAAYRLGRGARTGG